VRVLRANLKWSLVSRSIGWCLALTLAIGITSCDALSERLSQRSIVATDNATASDLALTNTEGPLSEVNVPASISQLAPNLAKFQPQVQILSPKPDQVLADDLVTVKLKVTDLPLFKNPELGLGNHVHVMLDRETDQGVYDLNQPLVFKNLAAGTHTLRVFAARPWHESFKNDGAFDRVTFHVLTKTAANNPDPQQPLLTYSRPTGTYGAEPILLDYYLTNAPSHAGEQGSSERVPDWRIRATVNDQQFILDRWAPAYLQGFKPGKNWVRLELLDDRGQPISNVYNDTLSVVTYDPQAKDPLTQLIRGEIDPTLARTLVDPNYVASKPPTATPTNTPVSTPIPSTASAPVKITAPIIAPRPISIASPAAKPLPSQTPAPASAPAPVPVPVIIPTPVTVPSPAPVLTPKPVAAASPTPVLTPTQIPVVTPNPAPVATPQPILIAPIPSSTTVEPIRTPVVIDPTLAPQIAPPATAPKTPKEPKEIAPVETPSSGTVTKSLPIYSPQPEIAKPTNPNPAQIADKPELLSPVTTRVVSPNRNQPAPVATMPPQVKVAEKPIVSLPPDRVEPPSPQLPQLPIKTPPIARIDRTPSLPSVTTPAVPNPPQSLESPEWQQQSIELLSTAKAKIRTFTNTIPAKSQRFGNNVRIWASYAKDYATDKIQAWREQH
jgi:hypothetical protein